MHNIQGIGPLPPPHCPLAHCQATSHVVQREEHQRLCPSPLQAASIWLLPFTKHTNHTPEPTRQAMEGEGYKLILSCSFTLSRRQLKKHIELPFEKADSKLFETVSKNHSKMFSNFVWKMLSQYAKQQYR
eukprot:1500997-Amphidinium_carterae.1